jgi:hypothetical protein
MCRPMPNVSINGRTRSFKRGCLCEKAEYEFANDQWTVQRRNFTSCTSRYIKTRRATRRWRHHREAHTGYGEDQRQLLLETYVSVCDR